MTGTEKSKLRRAKGKSSPLINTDLHFFDPRKSALSVLSAVRFWVFAQAPTLGRNAGKIARFPRRLASNLSGC